jgi:septal ring factor EnvC (AmiA/AmiB activator)
MEDMYLSFVFFSFINGALLLATVYYVITAHQTKVAYESMLEHQSSLQSRQSYENQLLREKAEDMETLITDIQSSMEKDNYSDLSNINNKIKMIEAVLENHSKSWALEQSFEKKVQESLSNIKQWIKRMGDDPTLIRGY